MNTPTFSTPRHHAAAFALALSLTLGMLAGVNGLALHGADEALMAAHTAAQTAAAAMQAARGG